MIGNEFRRIALAQGLLPTKPPAMPLPEPDPPADDGGELTCPANKPAMAERHAQDA